MLEETHDNQEIIGRVAALDIGKAELVCCIRAGKSSLCLLSWSFSRSFHRPQLNRTRPYSPESKPNLTWADQLERRERNMGSY